MSEPPPHAFQVTGWRDLVVEGRAPRFALICLGTWLTAAETLMTATVMPSVAKDIGGYAWFGWVVALFFIGSILAGATAGQLSIRIGIGRAMKIAGLVYAAGCAACALAPTMGLFLAGRLLQGVGGGWVVGLCFVAVTALFPPRLWSRAFSGLAGVWGVATLISPLVGGLFAQAGFWRGAFWLFALQGVAFSAAVGLLVPTHAAATPAAKPPVASLAALTAAIVCIGAAGLTPSAAQAVALGGAGCGLLMLFLHLNARAPSPLLPRRAGDPSSGVGAGLLVVFGFSAATASLSVYGAALFQTLHGAGPVLVGYILGADAMAWTLAALLVAGRANAGVYLRVGSVCILLSILALALATPHGSLILAVGCAVLQGAGFGLIWAFTAARIVANAPAPEQALASSANPTTQMIGVAVGAAVSGAIANLLGFGDGLTRARAERGGFWLFAAFAPLALAACAAAWRLASTRFTDEAAPTVKPAPENQGASI